jgi:hypothetical protein
MKLTPGGRSGNLVCMDAFQRAQRAAFFRRQAMRRRQAPPPISARRAPPALRSRYGRQLFGAEETLGSTLGAPDMLYGIIPMAVVVGAGLWMALRG